MSEGGPDGLIPYPMPDAFTEDAGGNIVPVRNILPRHTVRGRFYENGPYSFCDQGDIHPQPCTCAMPQSARLEIPGGFGESLPFFLGAPGPRSVLSGERVEITADFCQCPACREARYEP